MHSLMKLCMKVLQLPMGKGVVAGASLVGVGWREADGLRDIWEA